MIEPFIMYPARIVEFDSATQLATVLISAEMVYSDTTQSEALKVRQAIRDVPVHTLFGGGWAITMPIAAGDTCTLFFSQVGYDHWLYKDEDTAGKVFGAPAAHLRRSFATEDGFALVGFNTIPRAVQNFTTDGSQWRDTDATQNIHLHADGSISVDSPLSVDITAPSINLTGDLNVTGTVTGGSGVFAGVVVETHVHAGDGGSGSGPDTGPPI